MVSKIIYIYILYKYMSTIPTLQNQVYNEIIKQHGILVKNIERYKDYLEIENDGTVNYLGYNANQIFQLVGQIYYRFIFVYIKGSQYEGQDFRFIFNGKEFEGNPQFKIFYDKIKKLPIDFEKKRTYYYPEESSNPIAIINVFDYPRIHGLVTNLVEARDDISQPSAPKKYLKLDKIKTGGKYTRTRRTRERRNNKKKRKTRKNRKL